MALAPARLCPFPHLSSRRGSIAAGHVLVVVGTDLEIPNGLRAAGSAFHAPATGAAAAAPAPALQAAFAASVPCVN